MINLVLKIQALYIITLETGEAGGEFVSYCTAIAQTHQWRERKRKISRNWSILCKLRQGHQLIKNKMDIQLTSDVQMPVATLAAALEQFQVVWVA